MIDWDHPLSSIEGRKAIVTGGSRGIGLAVATGLCTAGADVIITGRSADTLEVAAEGLRRHGTEVFPMVAHSRKPEHLELVAETAAERLGGVDFLVNNVGVNVSLDPLHEMEPGLLQTAFETNVRAYHLLSSLVVPLMRGAGSIVNVSSLGGLLPAPRVGAYSVTKAAVNMLTRQMAMELAPVGIRVNAVAPGVITTRFSAAYWDTGEISEPVPPIGRWGEAEEVASAILFLLSDLAGFITGEIVVIDGGASVARGGSPDHTG